MARVITVTSGKGGVGKTNISLNLALHLAKEGYRTCLFDADMGLANINILLGLYPEFTMEDVILNGKGIDDIMIKDFNGIDIIPGSSGVQKMTELDETEIKRMVDSLSKLDSYDFLLVDTSAGISKNVISFCLASSEVMLVLTPEPTSLTDGYALLKVLSLNGFEGSVMVSVNQCKNMQTADIVFKKFREAVHKYLPLRVQPLGSVVHDRSVREAVKEQNPFLLHSPGSNASKCIKNIGRHLILKENALTESMGDVCFWERCVTFFAGPVKLPGRTSGKRKNPNSMAPSHVAYGKGEKGSPANDKDRTIEKKGSVPGMKDNTLPEQDMSMFLRVLAEGISTMSYELVAIRKVMEADRRRREPA
ncbi:MAG: MinD/ParA family protein [Deltaproteobacteria bacterium]|nr:MinD/ParA family protein [Deltaproteobacteria bacterium]